MRLIWKRTQNNDSFCETAQRLFPNGEDPLKKHYICSTRDEEKDESARLVQGSNHSRYELYTIILLIGVLNNLSVFLFCSSSRILDRLQNWFCNTLLVLLLGRVLGLFRQVGGFQVGLRENRLLLRRSGQLLFVERPELLVHVHVVAVGLDLELYQVQH